MKSILLAIVHFKIGLVLCVSPVFSEVRPLELKALEGVLEVGQCQSQLPLLHRRVAVDDYQSYDAHGQAFSEFRPALYSAGRLNHSRGIYIFDGVRNCLRAIHRPSGEHFAVHSEVSEFLSSREENEIYESLEPAIVDVSNSCEDTRSSDDDLQWYLNGSQDIPYCWIYAMARRLDFLFEFERRVIFVTYLDGKIFIWEKL